jgi:hypothetical protein
MRKKREIARWLAVRRGLGEDEAAVFVGVSPSYFRELVERNIMPLARRLGKRRIWDIRELNAAFDELPREKDDRSNDSWSDYR